MRLSVLIVILVLLFSGCSQTTTVNEPTQEDRDLLKQVAEDYLKEGGSSSNTNSNIGRIETEVIVDNSINEEEIQTDNSDSSDDIEEVQEEVEKIDGVDIEVLGVEVDYPRNFDLREEDDDDDDNFDTVEFTPVIKTTGFRNGKSFVIEITVRLNGDEVESCAIFYKEGEDMDYCEVDELPSVTEYVVEVYADDNNVIEEVNEFNNFYRTTFDLDEDS